MIWYGSAMSQVLQWTQFSWWMKSSFVPGFEMTAEEKADLLAFLLSLTDRDFLKDPLYSDPWKEGTQP